MILQLCGMLERVLCMLPQVQVCQLLCPPSLLLSLALSPTTETLEQAKLHVDCPFELLLNLGMLSAWDTRQNKCFIHWEGDSSEIGK